MFIVYLLIAVIYCIIWGCVTQQVIYNKGYEDNWFWWGFLFGFFALIVACTKPQNIPKTQTNYNTSAFSSTNSNTSIFSDKPSANRNTTPAGSWKCSCGRINPHYTGTCACGMSQHKQKEKEMAQEKAEQNKSNQPLDENEQLKNLKLLKEYKELLDTGIITQEEFEKKKAELL